MPTIKRLEIINKKKFARTALDENIEAFIVHVTFFNLNSMLIHPARKAQIPLLIAKEGKIPTNNLDFLDVFLEKKALVLPEIIDLN